MKKRKVKQIVAMAGVVILVGMYLLTLIAAIFATEYAHGLFMASLWSTLVIPILIYGFMIVYKRVHKEEDGISIRQLKKMNKEIKHK